MAAMFIRILVSAWLFTACNSMTCDNHCALNGKLCENRGLAEKVVEREGYVCRKPSGKIEDDLVIANITQVENRWGRNRAAVFFVALGLIFVPGTVFYRYMKKG